MTSLSKLVKFLTWTAREGQSAKVSTFSLAFRGVDADEVTCDWPLPSTRALRVLDTRLELGIFCPTRTRLGPNTTRTK